MLGTARTPAPLKALACILPFLLLVSADSPGCFFVKDRAKHFGVCQKYLKYNNIFVNQTSVAAQETEALRMIEEIEKTAVHNKDFVGPFKSAAPTCHRTYEEYMCQRYLPSCYTNADGIDVPVYNCRSTCENTYKQCSRIFKMGRQSNQLPQCEVIPDQTVEGQIVPYKDEQCLVAGRPVGVPAIALFNADLKPEFIKQLATYKRRNGGSTDGFTFSKTGVAGGKAPAATPSTTAAKKGAKKADAVATAATDDAAAAAGTQSVATANDYDYSSAESMFAETNAVPVHTCPRPLVRNPLGPDAPISIPNCPMEGCCMPCPFYHTLFPAGAIRRVEIWLTFLNLLSVPFTLTTLYLVGSRAGAFRSTKMLTVLFSLLNVFAMQAVEGLLLVTHDGGKDYMCSGPVKNAINKPACTLEGAAYTFFGMSFAWAEVVFNLNLFVLLQFKRPLVKSRGVLIGIFGLVWAACAALTIVPYASSGSVHMFGTHCNPQNMELYTHTGVWPVILGLLLNVLGAAVNVFKIVQLGTRHFGSAFFTSSAATLKAKIDALQREQRIAAAKSMSASNATLMGSSDTLKQHAEGELPLEGAAAAGASETASSGLGESEQDYDEYDYDQDQGSDAEGSRSGAESDVEVEEVRETSEHGIATARTAAALAEGVSPAKARSAAAKAAAAEKRERKKRKRRNQMDFNLFLSARRLVLLSLLVAISMSGFMVWWFSDAEPKLSRAKGLMGLDSQQSAAAAPLNGTMGAADMADDNIEAADASTVEWGQAWIDCLVKHEDDDPISGGQNACSYIPQAYVPTQKGWTTMELMSSVMGILYFLALGTSFADWSRIFAPRAGARKAFSPAAAS